MRWLLAAFVTACLALAAAATFLLTPLWSGPQHQRPPHPSSRTPGERSVPAAPAAASPRAPLSVAPDAAVHAPHSPAIQAAAPADVSTADPTAKPARAAGDIHWADQAIAPQASALQLALRTLRDDPHHPAALRTAADIMVAEGRWAMAIPYLSRLASDRPHDAQAQWEYAAALMRLERWSEAVEPLRRVVELRPESLEAAHNLGIAYQALGRLQEALAAWNAVLAVEPNHAAALAYRGEVFADLNNWRAAAADYRAALMLEPEAGDLACNLAAALLHLERFGEARETLASIRSADDAIERRRIELCWKTWLADPSGSADLAARALASAERLLARDPDQPELATIVRALREAAKP